jgi:predicted RNase H-like nuclease (RuvC/YqgF family)
MDSGGMRDDTGFFASELQKEAGRVINLKNEKIDALDDTIADLKHRMADQMVEIERLTAKYNEEHKLRTKRRGWLDWIIGYVG